MSITLMCLADSAIFSVDLTCTSQMHLQSLRGCLDDPRLGMEFVENFEDIIYRFMDRQILDPNLLL